MTKAKKAAKKAAKKKATPKKAAPKKAAPKKAAAPPRAGRSAIAAAPVTLRSAVAASGSSTMLTVTVRDGIPPLSIIVALFKDGTKELDFTASSSFSHLFANLSAGSTYDITIGGFNPSGGNTVCALTTDNIKLTANSDPNPSGPLSGVAYRVDFNFTA